MPQALVAEVCARHGDGIRELVLEDMGYSISRDGPVTGAPEELRRLPVSCAEGGGPMNAWNRYWFADTAYVNLAVLRISACFVLLFHTVVFHDYPAALAERFAYDDSLYRPIVLLKLVHAPFGLITGAPDLGAVRPPDAVVSAIFVLTVVGGILGLVGLMSRVSLAVAAVGFAYIQGFVYSFKDFHHPEAILAIGLTVLALAPSGHVLLGRQLAGGRAAACRPATSSTRAPMPAGR